MQASGKGKCLCVCVRDDGGQGRPTRRHLAAKFFYCSIVLERSVIALLEREIDV